MSVKQQDRELNPLKSRKPSAAAAAPSRSHQKPWPGRKIVGGDSELIKHMANLPCYLHDGRGRKEGDSALDIGVMEWGLLEKWAYNQRRLGYGDSPSTSNSSVSLSSSSRSLQGADSPLFLSKQSSPLSDGRKSASRDDDDRDHVVESRGLGTLDGDKDHAMEEPSATTSPKSDESDADPKRRLPKHKKSLSFDFGNARPPRLPDSVPRYIRSLSGHRPHLGGRGEFARHSCTGAIPHEGISSVDKLDRGSDDAGMRISNQQEKFKKFAEMSKKLIKQYSADDDEIEDGEESGVHPAKGIELFGRQKWPGRSSVLRNHNLPKASDGVQADRDARNGPRRRSSSPLRKMIEPFLKSKDRRRLLGSDTRPNYPKSSSSREGSVSSNDEPMDTCEPSAAENPENGVLSAVEDCPGSTRQALLQLAWKQEAPLIIFSASGGGVTLVASIKKEEPLKRECSSKIVYAINMVPEAAVKKKTGGPWSSHGSKSRKQGFLSTPPIAQMRVSSADSVVPSSCISKGRFARKVFVLFGDELEPSSSTESSSSPSSFEHELAAIVVTTSRGGDPNELVLKSVSKEDPSTAQREDLLTESDAMASSNVVAIVPRGIHGSSEDKGMPPPPLIRRWQSSGSCDCGGWDEGCSLTVLSDVNDEEPPCSFAPLSPLDDIVAFRADLFPKVGGSQDRRHGFSLVAFNKEGLYTVEFANPISSLQAFGICIAALHGRRGPLRHTSMPDNPPPSPVGIAKPAF